VFGGTQKPSLLQLAERDDKHKINNDGFLFERTRRVGHIARMGDRRAYTGFWWGNLRERDHLEDPGVDGSIVLRCILRKWDVGVTS